MHTYTYINKLTHDHPYPYTYTHTAPQRNYHLRSAISQLNGLLYTRMLSKGHISDNNPDSVLQADISSGLTSNMVSQHGVCKIE